MKPNLSLEPNPSAERIRQAVTTFAAELGDSCVTSLLERKTIGTTETKIAHAFKGGVPRWRVYNAEGPGVVYQTQPADRNFLYLRASAAVTVSLELF